LKPLKHKNSILWKIPKKYKVNNSENRF